MNFTGTTGATNDSNPANNVSNDSATIIDALNDATILLSMSLPACGELGSKIRLEFASEPIACNVS